ncbi:MAG: hypothetical protein JXR76_16060 [Deltaproteobacteria bacterium]|nr:hypothetical protein [Deltaproteobacteria bacterium]
MKTKTGLIFVFIMFIVLGCSKDDQVLSFCSDVEGMSKDIVAAVDGNSDKSAGVDAALKILNEKGPAIKNSYTEMQDIRGFQVSEETVAKMTETVTSSVTNVMKLKLTLVTATMKDEALSKKVDELMDGYQGLFM